jgi:thiol-disulfide isomerase/thioredoxin
MKTLIVFYRENCPPSDDAKKYFMKKRGRRDVRVEEYNVDKNKDIATKYEIHNTPTAILLDEKKNVVKRLDGLVPNKEYDKLFDEPLKVETTKKVITVELLIELISANTKDFKFLLDNRDKGVTVEEPLITAEATQAITLMYLLNYCKGVITKEELINALVEIK